MSPKWEGNEPQRERDDRLVQQHGDPHRRPWPGCPACDVSAGFQCDRHRGCWPRCADPACRYRDAAHLHESVTGAPVWLDANTGEPLDDRARELRDQAEALAKHAKKLGWKPPAGEEPQVRSRQDWDLERMAALTHAADHTLSRKRSLSPDLAEELAELLMRYAKGMR